MKAINERLQRIQDEQAARVEDLERGRIRIERMSQQKRTTHTTQTQEPKKAAN
jgi:hypothetical protein